MRLLLKGSGNWNVAWIALFSLGFLLVVKRHACTLFLLRKWPYLCWDFDFIFESHFRAYEMPLGVYRLIQPLRHPDSVYRTWLKRIALQTKYRNLGYTAADPHFILILATILRVILKTSDYNKVGLKSVSWVYTPCISSIISLFIKGKKQKDRNTQCLS
jgi:hypothetical protein